MSGGADMKYDENERIVKEALNTINTPLYDFKKEVKEKIIAKQRPILIRRRLNIGLVAIIIVILSGTVLASTLPSINKLFSIISPEMGKLLQPVGEFYQNMGDDLLYPMHLQGKTLAM